ncbi:hypothetical protein QL285_036186 [Trifolium repens]|nr:hypothetical protein QL285_036186 [Trifolium repens]
MPLSISPQARFTISQPPEFFVVRRKQLLHKNSEEFCQDESKIWRWKETYWNSFIALVLCCCYLFSSCWCFCCTQYL